MENHSLDFPRNWCLWYAFLGKIDSHKKKSKICPRNNSEGPMVKTLNVVPLLGCEFLPTEVFTGTILGFVYKKLVEDLRLHIFSGESLMFINMSIAM
jgi:hypothetical protein